MGSTARSHAVPDAVAPPPGNPRFPGVDGLRAIAALSVVVFHADQFSGTPGAAGRLLSHLDVGVAVFFTITGFLLYRPYVAAALGVAPRTPARLFYWRRFLRIVPGYWVALLVLAPVLAFASPAGVGNFLFLQIYKPAWVRSGIPPGWSVCVEVSFYVLLPGFAALLQRRWSALTRPARRHAELRLLAAMAVGSLLLRVLVHHFVSNPYMVDPLPTTLAWFCGGMALAVLSVEPGAAGQALQGWARRRPGRLWGAALLLYAATLSTTGTIDTESVLVFVGYGLIAALILIPVVIPASGEFAGTRFLSAAPAAWLGLVSYGIYLYHYPLMRELHPGFSPTLNLLVLAAAGAAMAVACGALSYYIVERPALRRKRGGQSVRLQRLLGITATQPRDGGQVDR